MSLKYMAPPKAPSFGMLAHSMSRNTFPDPSSLSNAYASELHHALNPPLVSKQDNEKCKSDAQHNSEKAYSKFNGNHSVAECSVNLNEPLSNGLSSNQTDTEAPTKDLCLTTTASSEAANTKTDANIVISVDEFNSIEATSSGVSEKTTVFDDDHSYGKISAGTSLGEARMGECDYTDADYNSDSSKAAGSSDQESKVVVQKLSNFGSDYVSNLEQCFSIDEILYKKPTVKRKLVYSDNGKEESAKDLSYASVESSVRVMQGKSFPLDNVAKRKMRRNHEMNLHIRPGKGVHLHDILHIVANIENASASLLSFLHKILFGTYGKCSNEDALSQTKRNILYFSGFPFSDDSEIFQVKRNFLFKSPFQMLHAICNTLLGKSSVTRNDAVEDVLCFLQKPTNNSIDKQLLKTSLRIFDEAELSQLKQQALTGPSPIVLLEKLSDHHFEKHLQKINSHHFTSQSKKGALIDNVPKREHHFSSNCVRLKNFPEVVSRIHNARRRIINLLHILFYGKPGSQEVNRSNILEFNGFSHNNETRLRRKYGFLKKLKENELDCMCSIFFNVKNCSKIKKIEKFLHYLKSPFQERKSQKRKIEPSVEPVLKLKDFEKIRRNVECASPQDLMELNDLLFLKPSSNLDIHEQILDFSSSSFLENSPEFHSRRTLLYYMSFESIRKIASILEISDWEEYTNAQNLATSVLGFLMDMKPPVKVRQKIEPRVHGTRKNVSSKLLNRPHLMRLQKANSCQENNFSEHLDSTSAMHTSTFVQEGLHVEKSAQNASVVVRRITESSYSFTDLQNKEPVTVSDGHSDESLSLYDFAKHPSDKQLDVTIREIICTNKWSSTMGDIINRVFRCYPNLNLTYRIDFIKAKALEVLHEIQSDSELFDYVK